MTGEYIHEYLAHGYSDILTSTLYNIQSSPPHEQWRQRFLLMLSHSHVNSTVSLNLAHVGSVADTSNGQPHEEKPIFQVLKPLVAYLYVGTLSCIISHRSENSTLYSPATVTTSNGQLKTEPGTATVTTSNGQLKTVPCTIHNPCYTSVTFQH